MPHTPDTGTLPEDTRALGLASVLGLSKVDEADLSFKKDGEGDVGCFVRRGHFFAAVGNPCSNAGGHVAENDAGGKAVLLLWRECGETPNEDLEDPTQVDAKWFRTEPLR